MRISSLSLEHYRCFNKLKIDFDSQLTVLVGENGSGKTTLLDAIAVFLRYYTNNHWTMPFSKEDIQKGFLQSTIKIQLDGLDDQGFFDPNKKTLFVSQFEFKKDTQEELLKIGTDGLKWEAKKWEKSPLFGVFCCYSANRIISKNNDSFRKQEKTSENEEKKVEEAYKNAFFPTIDFASSLSWFINKSSEEALKAKRLGDLHFSMPELAAVKSAISMALGEYSEPYIDETPPELFICKKYDDVPYSIYQLSDGYRTMLALVMDLARRMAIANKHLDGQRGVSILNAPGIVLIDEVELHLHPKWQQTVLPSLIDIFPNIQFIVTTHSPQVLSSIESRHIRILRGNDKVYSANYGTMAAESNRLLEDIFFVSLRAPSTARDELMEYASLVHQDQWDSDNAKELRKKLDERYGGNEPKLFELDMYIQNKKWELEDKAK